MPEADHSTTTTPKPPTDDHEIGRLVDDCLAFVADWNADRLDAPGDDPDANSAELVDRHSQYVRDICARRAGFEGVRHKLRLGQQCEGLPDYQHALVTSAAADLAAIRSEISASVLGGKLAGSFTTQIADLARAWAGFDPAPDAELAAIGHEIAPKLDEVRVRTDEWFKLPIERADEIETLIHHDRLWELYDGAVTLRATTMNGVRAKLLLARWQLEVEHRAHGFVDTENLSPTERMTWSLCNDLLGSVSGEAA